MSFLTALLASIPLYIIVFTGIMCWKLRFVSKTALHSEKEVVYKKEEVDEVYAMYVDENGELHEVLANPW